MNPLILDNPNSSHDNVHAFKVQIGNPWDFLTEVDKNCQEIPDEDLKVDITDYFKQNFESYRSTKKFVCYPDTTFINSHQISNLLVSGQIQDTMVELAIIHSRTLELGVIPPHIPETFSKEMTAPILDHHAEANLAILEVAKSYNPSDPNHKSLPILCLNAEEALANYILSLYNANLYGTTSDPILDKMPHLANFPTPFLLALERMDYEEHGVNPYTSFLPDSSSNSVMSK